ncbi:dihydrofolate reductase family protein [Dietzia sp. B19]|uniref:dihydrofolate reductase family protein n=1 Tax=Dietzia sp. B19 TaxID=1630632 RepID=UPI0019D53D93
MRRDLTKDGQPFAWPYTVPSWVVTHRDIDPVDGVEFFAGDVGDLHPLLVDAADGGDVWIVGGGDLAGQFADRGLLDRVWIHQCPVVLGSGRPLLPRRLRLHRQKLETHGQFTAMLFDVVGPEPRITP